MMPSTSEREAKSGFAPGPREAHPPPVRATRAPSATAALLHGGFLALTGAWPLVSLRSFAKVTGPKPERWLTRGMGALILNVGVALGSAGLRGAVAPELRLLGLGAGVTFAALDIYYAGARRRISPVYLLDAAAQLAFAGLWLAAEVRETRARRSRPPEAAFA